MSTQPRLPRYMSVSTPSRTCGKLGRTVTKPVSTNAFEASEPCTAIVMDPVSVNAFEASEPDMGVATAIAPVSTNAFEASAPLIGVGMAGPTGPVLLTPKSSPQNGPTLAIELPEPN